MRLVILAISVKKILTEDFVHTVQNATEVNSKNTSKEASTSTPEIQAVENTTTFDIDAIINNITSQISQVSTVSFFHFHSFTNLHGIEFRRHIFESGIHSEELHIYVLIFQLYSQFFLSFS